MYSKIPEVDCENLSQGDLHMGLETDPKTHGYIFQPVIHTQVSVHSHYRCEQILIVMDFLEENAVTVCEIEPKMNSHSIYEFPVPVLIHSYFLVVLPEHGEYGTLVPVAQLGLVGEIFFNVHPESQSGRVTSAQTELSRVVLRESAGGKAEEYDNADISHDNTT